MKLYYKACPDSVPWLQVADVSVYLTELPGKTEKSGYHLVVSESDLPKPEEPLQQHQAAPRTLQGIRNQKYFLDISHLEKAVGQLLAAGYATNGQSRYLLLHLKQLVRAYETLHLGLLDISDDKLRLADEAAAGKT